MSPTATSMAATEKPTAKTGASNGRSLRVPPSSQSDFTISAVALPLIIVPGSLSTVTVNDAVVTRNTGATVDNNWHVSTDSDCEFSSLDPSIATVDPDSGVTTRVSTGYARIRARAYDVVDGIRRYYLTKEITVYTDRTTGTTVDTLDHYVTGSLARHLCDQIDNRIVTATTSDKPFFSAANYAASTYTRNATCWTNNGTALDTTCVGISAGPNVYPNRLNRQNGVAITPTVALFANHNRPYAGLVLDFVTTAGATVQRTITDTYSFWDDDGCLARLDSALPGTITPAKVWPQPAAWTTRLPSVSRPVNTPGTFALPVLQLDQEKKAIVNENYACDPNSDYVCYTYSFEAAPPLGTSQRLALWEPWVNGDSGSGIFYLFENQLVLRKILSGIDPSYLADTIAAVLSSWGSAAMTIADVSAYPTYP